MACNLSRALKMYYATEDWVGPREKGGVPEFKITRYENAPDDPATRYIALGIQLPTCMEQFATNWLVHYPDMSDWESVAMQALNVQISTGAKKWRK